MHVEHIKDKIGSMVCRAVRVSGFILPFFILGYEYKMIHLCLRESYIFLN